MKSSHRDPWETAFECGKLPVSYFRADCIKQKLHRGSTESGLVSRCVLFSSYSFSYIIGLVANV